MNLVIIGGGIAATEAAIAAREANPKCRITMFSAENILPYRRPALSRMVGETQELNTAFFIKKPEFFVEKQIDIKLNISVKRIFQSHILLNNGQIYPFDRLIIATGAESFFPPVKGLQRSERIIGLRNYADMLAMRKLCLSAASAHRNGGKSPGALILGCGVLSLELAEAMLKYNIPVSILESCGNLMPRQLDSEAAELVTGKLNKVSGLSLNFGVNSTNIEVDNAGERMKLFAADGRVFCGDFIAVSAGARPLVPELTELKKINLCRSGIAIDQWCCTGEKDIFAAGDCAAFEEFNPGLYLPAKNAGRVAGHNSVCFTENDRIELKNEWYPVRLNVFGLVVFSAGRIAQNLEAKTEKNSDGMLKVFCCDKMPVGVLSVGNAAWAERARQIAAGIKNA